MNGYGHLWGFRKYHVTSQVLPHKDKEAYSYSGKVIQIYGR